MTLTVISLTQKQHKFHPVDEVKFLGEVAASQPNVSSVQLSHIRGVMKELHINHEGEFDEKTVLNLLEQHEPDDVPTIREALTGAKSRDEKIDIIEAIILEQFGHHEVK